MPALQGTYVFSVNVFDEVEKIVEGTHERFIVDNEKFMTKAGGKCGVCKV